MLPASQRNGSLKRTRAPSRSPPWPVHWWPGPPPTTQSLAEKRPPIELPMRGQVPRRRPPSSVDLQRSISSEEHKATRRFVRNEECSAKSTHKAYFPITSARNHTGSCRRLRAVRPMPPAWYRWSPLLRCRERASAGLPLIGVQNKETATGGGRSNSGSYIGGEENRCSGVSLPSWSRGVWTQVSLDTAATLTWSRVSWCFELSRRHEVAHGHDAGALDKASEPPTPAHR
jgi:hypothetical protein